MRFRLSRPEKIFCTILACLTVAITLMLTAPKVSKAKFDFQCHFGTLTWTSGDTLQIAWLRSTWRCMGGLAGCHSQVKTYQWLLDEVNNVWVPYGTNPQGTFDRFTNCAADDVFTYSVYKDYFPQGRVCAIGFELYEWDGQAFVKVAENSHSFFT